MDEPFISHDEPEPQLVDGVWRATCPCGEEFAGSTAADVEDAYQEHVQNLPGDD
jgi:hypothetical protein